jgi:hypothetical protein
MTRLEQNQHNQDVIALILLQGQCGYRVPAYEDVVVMLNSQNLRTSTGNAWTRKALFRMLQRNGFGGLHGLRQTM